METTIEAIDRDVSELTGEFLFLPLFEGQEAGAVESALDRQLDGIITRVKEKGLFQGKFLEQFLIAGSQSSPFNLIMLGGLGRTEDFNAEVWRQVCGKAGKTCPGYKVKEVFLSLPQLEVDFDLLENAVVGFQLGSWQFREYQTGQEDEYHGVERLVIPGVKNDKAATDKLNRGKAIAKAVIFARNLAQRPGNVVTPTYLAEEARRIANEGGLKIRIIEESEAEELNLGGFLAVSRGSQEPGKFIIMEYQASPDAPTIGLVGKGITFDSGGISLKGRKGMDEMKYDMSGAAITLGVMQLVTRLRPAVNIVAAIPCAENLPGGRAYKPGDIIRSYQGKTVEIKNTDAEGRLLLMDGLAYLNKNYQLSALLNIATLTGAIVIALGHEAAGIFGNNQELLSKVQKAAEETGERVWTFPLWKEYSELIKSKVADIQNIGPAGEAGSIVAAAFLKEFVEDTPWVHLDIAGTAWRSKDRPYEPAGPTASGLRTLYQLIESYESI